jgi:hypothetical protein
MVDIIIAIGSILALLSGWIFIQQLATYYAARHPEFGPAREEGSGCGKSCMCSNGLCEKRQKFNNDKQNNSMKNQENHPHDLPQ